MTRYRIGVTRGREMAARPAPAFTPVFALSWLGAYDCQRSSHHATDRFISA